MLNLSFSPIFRDLCITRFFILGFFFSFWPICTFAQQESVYALDSCVRYALSYHKRVKNSELMLLQQKERVKTLKSTWLPQVTAGASYQFMADRNVQPDGRKRFNNMHQLAPSISVTQQLYNPGISTNIAIAQLREAIATYDFTRSEIDVIVAVKKAYHAWRVSVENLRLVEANIKRTQKALHDTKLKYENGLAQKVDVNRLRVTLNNSTTQKATIERDMQLQIKTLQFQMGMNLDGQLKLKADDNIESYLEEPDLVVNPTAYQGLGSYKTARENLEIAKLQIKQVKQTVYPNVALSGSYRHNFASKEIQNIFDDPMKINIILGASISIPIYQGGKLKHQQREANYGEQLQQNAIDLLVDKIKMEQSQTLVKYQNSLDVLKNQRENKDLAEQIYENIRYQYNNGIRPSIEVITAEAAVREADNAYVRALYDAFTSQIEYQDAVGRITPEQYNQAKQ